MILGIVLSKDRPAQLDLLLRSIFQNAPELCGHINVVYKASNQAFDFGYQKLQDKHSVWVDNKVLSFTRQVDSHPNQDNTDSSFKQDVMNTLHSHPEAGRYVVFFTDDDIVYRQVPKTGQVISDFMSVRPGLACVSLRLGNNTYVQDEHANQRCPMPTLASIQDGFIVWNWRSVPAYTNFAYPLSVDGHIFNRGLMMSLLGGIEFTTPNFMEGNLQHHEILNVLQPTMACFPKSMVVNTPINRVQAEFENKAGVNFGISPLELNDMFIEGYELDLDSIDADKVIGCHQEMRLEWVKK